jgi:hypothetical protein
MVMVFAAQLAVTPAGRPVAVPIPVPPVVVWVILVKRVLMHRVWLVAVPTVLAGVIIIVPVAFKLLQPPVRGMV